MIPDQVKMWDKKHGEGDHAKLRGQPSPLAELAEPYFSPNSHVLELGCGVGRDAVYFAGKGHTVTATDGSGVVIRQNRQQLADPAVNFSVLDIRQKLPYKDAGLAVVYANLSLHYYLDAETRRIIAEITRVLAPGGVLAFACKSRDDFRSEGAETIEENVVVGTTGHAMHFFSEDYAKNLLKGDFEILYLDDIDEEYNGRVSGIVRCIAKKKGPS